MPPPATLLIINLLLSFSAFSQSIVPAGLPDDDSKKTSISPGIGDSIVYEDARLNIASYYRLIKDNFRRQAFFPVHLKGKDWLRLGVYTTVSGAIAFSNQSVKTYAVNLRQNNKGIAAVSKYVTRFGDPYIKYILGAGLAAGLLSKDRKLETTTLLASQAYFISNVLGGAIKLLTGVQAPFYTDPFTNKSEPVFRGPFYTLQTSPDGQHLKLNNYGSFPSGHTYSAFAVATVYAMQYKNKPLIPIVAYSIATLVGLSRLTENRHWAMDIIPGALLGYYSAKQVVNNYGRFCKEKKMSRNIYRNMGFNMQYINSHITTGIVYRF